MSLVVLQALLAAYALVTFTVAVRLRGRARVVTMVFPNEIVVQEPGRHSTRRQPVLV